MSDQTPQQPGWGPPPGPPPPPGSEPSQPQKKRTGPFRAGFLGCFGVLAAVVVVIIVVAVIASSGSKTTTATPNASESEPVATTPATEAPQTTATPKPKRWAKVISVSGSSDKRTDVFTLHGGKTKLTYKFTDTSGLGTIVGAIYVLDEGDSLAKSGGIPEVTVSQPGSDSTFLAKDAGRYYLDISAANARWTVTIQEYR
jgi:hypothetical protein